MPKFEGTFKIFFPDQMRGYIRPTVTALATAGGNLAQRKVSRTNEIAIINLVISLRKWIHKYNGQIRKCAKYIAAKCREV